jgi:hypothetical protein
MSTSFEMERTLSRTLAPARERVAGVWVGRAAVAGAWAWVFVVIAAFMALGPGLLVLSPVVLFGVVGLVGEAHAYAARQERGV